MSKRTKWLNIIGTAILIILGVIVIGACALAFLNLDDFSLDSLLGGLGDNASVSTGDGSTSSDSSGSSGSGSSGDGSGSGSGGGLDFGTGGSSSDGSDDGDGSADGEQGDDGGEGGSSGDGGSESGDGSSGSAGAGNLNTSGVISGGSTLAESGAEGATAFSIYSDKSGTLYLKLINFADYNGSGWSQASAYGSLISGEYSMSYLFGLALANGGYSATLVQVDNHTSDYYLPYQLSTLSADYDVQTSDVYYSGSTAAYSAYVYYYDYLTNGVSGLSLSSSYSSAESKYRTYVYNNYLAVNSSTHAALESIIDEQNLYSSDTYTCISNIVNYVKNAATYNLKYDSALDGEDDIVVAFLTEYKEGICQHYASAATLLLRACGIPARYTTGYVATTSAGQWTDVTTSSAHAWVEVYINGLGWVTVDPTGGSSSSDTGDSGSGGGSGSGTGDSGSGGGSGSGTGDSGTGGSGSGGSGGSGSSGTLSGDGTYDLEAGGEYSFTADGGGTYTFTAGEGGSFTLTDGDGNEWQIGGSESVDINLSDGATLDITANNDGELSISGGSGGSGSGGTLSGDGTYDLEAGGEYGFTADGGGTYTFTAGEGGSFTLTDGDGNEWQIGDGESVNIDLSDGATLDITADNDGELSISGDTGSGGSGDTGDTGSGDTGDSGSGDSGSGSGSGGTSEAKISITIASESGSRTYTGYAVSLQSYNCTSGALLDGHKIVCTFTEWTEVGAYSNVFTAKIVDGEGNDVSSKYSIEYEYGTFNIIKRQITLTTGSNSKTYDGQPLTYEYYYFSAPYLAEGHYAEVVFSGSQTSRGESENSVSSITIYDEDGNDVTKNYAIDIVYGTLSVT